MRAFDTSSQLADTAPIWLADTPTLADDDPMAQVLPWLVSHLGVAETLADEAGLDAAACHARPGQLLQSLQQLGFDTRLNHDPVTALRADDLPAVLRLRSGDACVLTALQGSPGTSRRCQVVVLTPEPMAFTVSDADLARECAGPALLVRRPLPRQRVAPVAKPMAKPIAERMPEPRAQPVPQPAAPPIAQAVAERTPRPVEVPVEAPTPTPIPTPAAAPTPLSMALAARRVALAESAEARRAGETAARGSASPSPSSPLHLPTLDDVIAPDELACLAHVAERPGRVAAWARTAPAATTAADAPSPMPPAAEPVAARPAAPPPLAAPARQTAAAFADALTPPLADTGPDVVLDLGFLDRQTGAGRLRGRVAQWQRQMRGQWARWGEIGRSATQVALARPKPQRRASAAVASWSGWIAGASGISDAPAAALAARAGQADAPTPARRSGWRPPFGLGWPLGQAPSRADAANAEQASRRDAALARREPTLAAVPAAALAVAARTPGAERRTTHASEHRHEPWPEVWAEGPGRGPAEAPAAFADPPRGATAPVSSASRSSQRSATPGRSAQSGSPQRNSEPVDAAPGEATSGPPVSPPRWQPWLRPARAALAWAGRLRPPGIDLRACTDQLAARSGLPRLAAALDRWRRSARLERWLQGPLLAACSAVCLLEGLPLAWARMVSVSGMKAAAGVLPGLMRHALAADQDRAVAVLAGPAQAVIPAMPRAAVPAAANASRLVGAAATHSSVASAVGGAAGAVTGPSTLAMVAARAEKAQRGGVRGIDVATTLRRRSEALSMGPPLPVRPRRALTAGVALMAA